MKNELREKLAQKASQLPALQLPSNNSPHAESPSANQTGIQLSLCFPASPAGIETLRQVLDAFGRSGLCQADLPAAVDAEAVGRTVTTTSEAFAMEATNQSLVPSESVHQPTRIEAVTNGITEKQQKMLYSLIKRKKMESGRIDELLRKDFGVSDVQRLSKADASKLISTLMAMN